MSEYVSNLLPASCPARNPHPHPASPSPRPHPHPDQAVVAPVLSQKNSRVKFVWPNVMASSYAMREFGTMCLLALLFGLLVFLSPTAQLRATGLTGMVVVGLWYIQWIHSVLRFTKS